MINDIQIIHDLEKLKNGANAHTVNKAICYLRVFKASKQINSYNQHIKNCKKAINKKSMSELKETMKRWV